MLSFFLFQFPIHFGEECIFYLFLVDIQDVLGMTCHSRPEMVIQLSMHRFCVWDDTQVLCFNLEFTQGDFQSHQWLLQPGLQWQHLFIKKSNRGIYGGNDSTIIYQLGQIELHFPELFFLQASFRLGYKEHFCMEIKDVKHLFLTLRRLMQELLSFTYIVACLQDGYSCSAFPWVSFTFGLGQMSFDFHDKRCWFPLKNIHFSRNEF